MRPDDCFKKFTNNWWKAYWSLVVRQRFISSLKNWSYVREFPSNLLSFQDLEIFVNGWTNCSLNSNNSFGWIFCGPGDFEILITSNCCFTVFSVIFISSIFWQMIITSRIFHSPGGSFVKEKKFDRSSMFPVSFVANVPSALTNADIAFSSTVFCLT